MTRRAAAPAVRFHVPSMEEAYAVARRSIQEQIPFDRAACEAIFPGGKPPRMYRDWPREAVDAWHAMEAVYTLVRKESLEQAAGGEMRQTGGRPCAHPEVTLSRAWLVVVASAANERLDQRLTWPDIAARLSVPPRYAILQVLGRLGFAFEGRYSTRRLVRAPCIRCALSHPVEALDKAHRCPQCRP